MSKHGLMYIHFNEHCLKKIDNKTLYAPDESFDYSVITLSQENLTKLNEEERGFLRKLFEVLVEQAHHLLQGLLNETK